MVEIELKIDFHGMSRVVKRSYFFVVVGEQVFVQSFLAVRCFCIIIIIIVIRLFKQEAGLSLGLADGTAYIRLPTTGRRKSDFSE